MIYMQCCQPQMAKYRRFQWSKNRNPIYCLETHFMAFISVHCCSPNTISRFLWACGRQRKQLHDLMWQIRCLKSWKSRRSTSKIVGLATLPPCQPRTWTYTRTCRARLLSLIPKQNRNKTLKFSIYRENCKYWLYPYFSLFRYRISILIFQLEKYFLRVRLRADAGRVFTEPVSPTANVPLTCQIPDHYPRLQELLFFFSQRHTANWLVYITGLSSLVSRSVE